MRHRSGRVSPNRDQFSGNGYGDFLRSDGSDVETNRRMHPIEKVGRHTFLLKRLENLNDLALGADHADIAGTSLNGPAEDTHIVSMAAGNDDDIRRFVGIQMLHGLVEVFRMNLASRWETLFGGEGSAVIGDNHVKSGIGSRLGKIDGNVACAENIKQRWR